MNSALVLYIVARTRIHCKRAVCFFSNVSSPPIASPAKFHAPRMFPWVCDLNYRLSPKLGCMECCVQYSEYDSLREYSSSYQCCCVGRIQILKDDFPCCLARLSDLICRTKHDFKSCNSCKQKEN